MNGEEKKKLLLVTAGFPYGEWERGFLSTEFDWLRKDFSVTVLSVGREDPLLYPVGADVQTERFLYPKGKRSNLLSLGHLLVPAVFWEALRAAKDAASLQQALRRVLLVCAYYDRSCQVRKAMERLVKAQEIDLVYTYWATEAAVAACQLKKKYPKLRVVTRFHGHDLYRERKGSGWQPFRKWIGDFADRLIFACQAGRDYFVKNWGFEQKTRLHYLGCSESTECPHGESTTLRVVSCSNLIPLKRVDLLIRGLALLPPDVSVRWDHFGDGEAAETLKQLATRVLPENVNWNFHGHVANHLLRQRFYQLDPDVFVTTSSTEGGVPVSIQEALSVGIPAIGTAVGGVPEAVVPGKTGFLLPPTPSAQEVADALLHVAALSQEERAALRSGALELWENCFCADRNAQAVMKELHELID